MKLRRYCWRVGIIVDLEDDERCGECGNKHDPLKDQSRCSWGVACPNATRGYEHGHACKLAAGHEGVHVGELHPDCEV